MADKVNSWNDIPEKEIWYTDSSKRANIPELSLSNLKVSNNHESTSNRSSFPHSRSQEVLLIPRNEPDETYKACSVQNIPLTCEAGIGAPKLIQQIQLKSQQKLLDKSATEDNLLNSTVKTTSDISYSRFLIPQSVVSGNDSFTSVNSYPDIIGLHSTSAFGSGLKDSDTCRGAVSTAQECPNLLCQKKEEVLGENESTATVKIPKNVQFENTSNISSTESDTVCCNCRMTSSLLTHKLDFQPLHCNEYSLNQILANSFAFFNIKTPDIHSSFITKTKPRNRYFSNSRSKSLSSLNESISEKSEGSISDRPLKFPKKQGKAFHLPSLHLFSTHKNADTYCQSESDNFDKGKMSPEVKNFQAVNPAATLLVFPQQVSGAPAIFLKQDTPNNSPAETPIRDTDRSMEDSLNHNDSDILVHSKCIEEETQLNETASESNSKSTIGNEEEEESPKPYPGCVASLKMRVIKRPTLQLPALGYANNDSLKSFNRCSSMLSALSIAPPSRRPSATSLLSVSPSVSLAGRRFSFNIGSRSEQMVSVSFKSLESFVNEDNLLGLKAFLESRSVVIDDRDENGASVLLLCASKGRSDFCREFLEHGADVNAEDNDQWTALIAAAKEGYSDVVQTLLDYDAQTDHRDLGGWSALMWACYKGHLQTTKILLAHKADPNARGQHHMSSLAWAAGRGHTEIVKVLLEKGAKVNTGDKFGTSPLIWACRKGYFEIAEDLLQNGANVDATGMYSWTPLLVATRGNYGDLVSLLLDYKPNVNALDKDGGTALTIACKEGFAEIATVLLRAAAYVNIQDRNGDSNLIFAARGGHKRVVEALLKKHADIDCVGKDRKTALYWAVEKDHTQVVKLLLSANADLEYQTKDGDTALMRAVRSKNADTVQMLVDKKARVSVADKKGDTALHIAMRGRLKRIVEILLRNPKNSQMLYRPNKNGETPYNIDLSDRKAILGQIFGARRLNTNEENENMLGYDLYSSSMADILSEPSLSMPISVGLYARWGSGKSFLIRKLKEEMNNFARQWVEPLFQFSALVFLIIIVTSLIIGFITLISTKMWYVGVATGGGVFLLITLLLIAVWYASRSKYDWHVWYRWSVALACHTSAFKLVAQVIFCSPPGSQWKEWKDGVQAKPLKFIFAEGAKPGSTGAGGNSVIQIMCSLFSMVEDQYGIFSTRFYRAFRPKAGSSSSPWKYRRLCGVPYIAIFFITLGCSLALTYLAITYGFRGMSGTAKATTPQPVKDPRVLEKREAMDSAMDLDMQPRILVKRKAVRQTDDEEDDDDDDEFDDDEDREHGGTLDDDDGQTLHTRLINPLLFILSALVALVVVVNIHTLVRMVKALFFSHRKHLLSAISKFDTMNAEGYLPTLKGEVSLLVEMVRCLDAFTCQQTRLVVILDGLDSCEQDKVLSVLDAVHTLFTDSNGPFIILLAIDPHIITRAIEINANKVFREASISGHDYLRNIIHLPFYLQNAGLRKVKLAEKASEQLKIHSQSTWNEQETEFVSLATTSAMGGLHHMPVTRHMSTTSELGFGLPGGRRMSGESGMSLSIARRNTAKSSRKLKASESVASSVASNLHRVSAASDLNKVLLTDDYFNDINPRSMRRLMNVVYITGRLLKAFHIEFNWYHLALWVNITEQWPYRASWLIHYYEKMEDTLEQKTTLKDLYERLKPQLPISKDMEPLLEMDKDERKFETFLSMHENVLHVYNLVIFLPFTINLDPYIKKKIKEEQIRMDENFPQGTPPNSLPWHLSQQQVDNQSRSSTLSWTGKVSGAKQFGSSHPASMNPLMWGYGPSFIQTLPPNPGAFNPTPSAPTLTLNSLQLPVEAQDKKLSSMNIDEIFELLEKVDGVSTSMLPTYKQKFKENNINGKVLRHCSLDDLKQIMKMTFGDWELLKMLVTGLREQEANDDEDLVPRNYQYIPNSGNFESQSNKVHLGDNVSEHSDVSNAPDGSAFRRGSVRTSFSNKDRDDSLQSSRRSMKHNLHAKQTADAEEEKSGSTLICRDNHKSEMPSLKEQHKSSNDTLCMIPEKEPGLNRARSGDILRSTKGIGTYEDGLDRVNSSTKVEEAAVQQPFTHHSAPSSRVIEKPAKQPYKSSHSLLERQVTLEEQMIFGALQTLNEEAWEDVLEEQARNEAIVTSYHLGIIGEDSDNPDSEQNLRKRSGSIALGTGASDEIDVVYLHSSPLLPSTVVSYLPDSESAAPSVASSLSPYKGSASLSRGSSIRGSMSRGSVSTTASPKHSITERPSREKISAIIENKEYTSPTRNLSQSAEASPKLRRDRPQSLNLNHPKCTDGRQRTQTEVPDYFEDNDSIEILSSDIQSRLASLPDILPGINGPKHVTLAEQISFGSSSSIDKLRRFTKKLHRVLSSHEDVSVATMGSSEEDSPLVVGSPTRELSNTNSVMKSSQNSKEIAPSSCISGHSVTSEESEKHLASTPGSEKAYVSAISPSTNSSTSVVTGVTDLSSNLTNFPKDRETKV